MFALLLRTIRLGIFPAVALLFAAGPTSAQTPPPAIAPDMPVIAIGLGTRVVLYQYHPDQHAYLEVWETVSTGRFFYENADTHWQIAFGDLNGNGRIEMASVDQWALNVWGDRGTTPVRAVLSPVPETHPSIAVADADGDGQPEILVGWRNQFSVWRYQNEQLHRLAVMPVGRDRMEMVWNINVADLDGDGHPDIVLGGTLLVGHQDVLRILRFDGDRLMERNVIPMEGAADVTRLYDWDGDGRPEIFTAGNGQRIQAFRWDPEELLYVRWWISDDLGGFVQGIALGDLIGNGVPEIAAGTYVHPGRHSGPPTLTIFTQRRGLPVPIARVVTHQVGYPGLLVADLNQDGRNELLLNGSVIYAAQRAPDGSQVFGPVGRIGQIAERPGEVQPNAAVTRGFMPRGSRDRTPAILVRDLHVERGGMGNRIGIGHQVSLSFRAENIGGEARDVHFSLIVDDPRVAVLDGSVKFAFVNSETNLDNRVHPFQLLVHRWAEPGPISLRIEVSTPDGYRMVREFLHFELTQMARGPR